MAKGESKHTFAPPIDNADAALEQYLGLIRAFPLVSIRDDAHLDAAVAMIDDILDRPARSSAEEAYLGALTDLVETYENAHVKIPPTRGVDALRFLMAANDLSRKDLVQVFGSPSIVSEVLSGKRRLALSHITRLSRRFGLPADVFVDDTPSERDVRVPVVKEEPVVDKHEEIEHVHPQKDVVEEQRRLPTTPREDRGTVEPLPVRSEATEAEVSDAFAKRNINVPVTEQGNDRALTTRDAACLAEVHPSTIRRWARTGQLRMATGATARAPRYRREDVLACKARSATTNTGSPYEQLTRRICENILAQKNVHTLDLCRNKIVRSPATSHQIDVYWRFKVDGHERVVLVQCKDWQGSVPKVEILAFAMIVELLGGDTKGIFVSRSGYQSGAIEVAAYCGIELYTLAEPKTDKDWEGLIRAITITTQPIVQVPSNVEIDWDRAWITAEKECQGLGAQETFQAEIGDGTGDVVLYDEAGTAVGTVRRAVEHHLRTIAAHAPSRHEYIAFEIPTYAHNSADPRMPRMKMSGITYDVTLIEAQGNTVRLKADDIVAAVLRNALPGATESALTDTVLGIDKDDRPLV
jgi:antitoxin component HigA of HigAB toxin-antitoxin module